MTARRTRRAVIFSFSAPLLQGGGIELIFGEPGVFRHLPGRLLQADALGQQGQHLGRALLQGEDGGL